MRSEVSIKAGSRWGIVFSRASFGAWEDDANMLTLAARCCRVPSPTVMLQDTISCSFFVKDQQKMFDLFGGFYEIFNKDRFTSALVLKMCISVFHVFFSKKPVNSHTHKKNSFPDTEIVWDCEICAHSRIAGIPPEIELCLLERKVLTVSIGKVCHPVMINAIPVSASKHLVIWVPSALLTTHARITSHNNYSALKREPCFQHTCVVHFCSILMEQQ